MRTCIHKLYFTVSTRNPHNIRSGVTILFFLCLVGVLLWVAPYIGYQITECDYTQNTSTDCRCQLNYNYGNCAMSGLMLILLCILTIILIVLIVHIGRRFYTVTLPVWREAIERSIKPISFIIATRNGNEGESQHLINSSYSPPLIYNKKWTQLKFMISDDNPDSLISPEQKWVLKITAGTLFIIFCSSLSAPFLGAGWARRYCINYTLSPLCPYFPECTESATRSLYTIQCIWNGLLIEWVPILMVCCILLLFWGIDHIYIDLPETHFVSFTK